MSELRILRPHLDLIFTSHRVLVTRPACVSLSQCNMRSDWRMFLRLRTGDKTVLLDILLTTADLPTNTLGVFKWKIKKDGMNNENIASIKS